MTSLQKRVLSGLVLVILTLGLIGLGPWGITFLITGVMIGLQIELNQLLNRIRQCDLPHRFWIASALITLLGIWIDPGFLIAILFLFYGSLQLHFALTRNRGTTVEQIILSLAWAALFLVYGMLIPSFALKIAWQKEGPFWFFCLLLGTLGSDTFAYFVGKGFGKTPLAPAISPKKTLEGAMGALAGVLILSLLIFLFFPMHSIVKLTVFFLGASLFDQIGDLFESLIKRVAGVKDSSNLIPGHGGILDRIDGVLFACPWCYLVSAYF